MNHFRERTLIIISGSIWLVIGIFLLSRGASLIVESCAVPHPISLVPFLARTLPEPQKIALILLAFGFFIGYIKGRFVFTRVAAKQIDRLTTLSQPTLRHIFTRKMIFLILGMMGLGFILKILPIGHDVRGIINTAVGFGLINGALFYFRNAIFSKLTPDL